MPADGIAIEAVIIGGHKDALVFTGPKGAALRRAGFRRCWWLPATDAAGLQGLRFHDLRHSFVSIWRDAGEDILDICSQRFQ